MSTDEHEEKARFVPRIWKHLTTRYAEPAVVEVHGSSLVPTDGRGITNLMGFARAFLRNEGVQPGDRVVLVAPNSARWVAADLSVLAEGAVVVPLYARQDPNELAEIIAHCKPALVVCSDGALLATLQDAADALPKTATFSELFADVDGVEPVKEGPIRRAGSDPATVVYTSGTSGQPKGVVLTHHNIDFMLARTKNALIAMLAQRPPEDQHDERVFHYLPFCFAGSRVVLWTCLYRAVPIHVSTDLDNLQAELAAVDPHYFLNVPMLLERIKNGVEGQIGKRPLPIRWLYRRGRKAVEKGANAGRRDRLFRTVADRLIFTKIRERIGPSLACLICGSAPLGEDTQRWFETFGIPVYQVYGLTETTAIVTMDVPPDVTPGRVGPTIDGVKVRLMDGELQVKGANVFAEYLFMPEETEAAFDDGWFKTGDQAEVDARGHWKIVGRVKNLLVPSSGHNVAPEPIEQKLTETVPGVDAAVLVGHGKPYLSAILSGEPGAIAEHDLPAAIERINNDLPHYRRVRKWMVAPEPFTVENGLLTANRKLRRQAIEQAYAEQIDGLYA
jgi:long-chain acyl-CoA synthetase